MPKPIRYAEDDPRLVFVPLDEAAKPVSGLCEVWVDRWWSVHPEKGLVFYRSGAGRRNSYLSAQCNPSERIARKFTEDLYGDWAECRQIPAVFRRANIRDYV